MNPNGAMMKATQNFDSRHIAVVSQPKRKIAFQLVKFRLYVLEGHADVFVFLSPLASPFPYFPEYLFM